jgi:hypothetical protein
MAQAVSRRPLIVSIPGQSMWDLWWTKVALRQVFLRALRFSPVNFNPPVLHYTENGKKTNLHHHRVAQ